MDYQVVPKAKLPQDQYGERGKWQKLFTSIDKSEVVEFQFASLTEAQRMRNNLRGCFRRQPFHTRIPPVNNGKWSLFAWLDKTGKE